MKELPNVMCPPPRISRACGRCRSTKARCLPSSQAPSCQRCLDKGYVCNFPLHSKRSVSRKQTKTQSTKSSSNSSMLDVIGKNSIASLGFQPSEISLTTNATRASDHAQDIYTYHHHVFDQLFDRHSDVENLRIGGRPKCSTEDTEPTNDNSVSITIPVLSENDVCEQLRHYQSLEHCFPFLPLPENWTVESMKRSHSFFLLGILAAVTQHQVSLNSHIHEQFLHVLAERVMIKAEKSLDLVRGMLAQLTRFPLHLDPRKGARRMFQILRLAATMIEELGFADLREQSWLDSNSEDLHLDQRRLADLACSCISSIAAVSFQRTNCAPLNKIFNRGTPAIVFANDQLAQSHARIYIQASLLRVAEQANRYRRESPLDAVDMYVNVECLRSEMQEISVLIRDGPVVDSGDVLRLSLHYAQSQVNAMVFGKSGSLIRASDGQSYDLILSAMQSCFEGLREFLETFASLPITEYRNLSFVQWAQLVQVLKLIPTLCFKIHDMPGWNTAQIRKELRFGMILESLCYRMQELTPSPKVQQNTDDETVTGRSTLPPDWFLMFKSVLKILKETYDRRCEEIERDGSVHHLGIGCPVLNGSIQDSEFWRDLIEFQQSGVPKPSMAGLDLSGADYQAGSDEWDSNSSEWIDLNMFDVGLV